ncbi:MAG: ATP-binding protein [Eubacterium sp.]|nr:ATP-binding protein [Eubacterium sp.]
MVVLNIKLDNFYAFKNFHMNLTYPKKIVGSSINEEHLPNRPNFRYKKVNVLLGSNASGKTTFGLIVMKIFHFIEKKNYDFVTNAINEQNKEASFVIDLASKNNVFYRVSCVIDPCSDGKYGIENIHVEVRNVNINSKDSYESCVKRIENMEYFVSDNYITELEKMGKLAWFFDYPKDNKFVPELPNKDDHFKLILENILKTLDPSITEVNISKDVDSGYVILYPNKSFVVQSEQMLDTDLLSSGTKSGVGIAFIVYSLMRALNSFYYCDERFSYISTDIEKAILSLMIDYVTPGEQLFFTTHNTDILDMDLPKHTFTFLRKDLNNSDQPITCVEASSLLKRNTDSLRNAVENDLFSTAPDLDLIYSISRINVGDK